MALSGFVHVDRIPFTSWINFDVDVVLLMVFTFRGCSIVIGVHFL